MMKLIEYIPGDAAVVLSIPHSGTYVPKTILSRFTDEGRALTDTDWHVEKLYDFAARLKIHILFATHSRYVVDLNRDPSGKPLYPGADNTEICPTTTFAHDPIYKKGKKPSKKEVEKRIETYWRPYHDKLASVVEKMVAREGKCVVFDAHSIRSEVPRFFEGTLPGLNVGTGGGTTAAVELIHRVMEALHDVPGTSCVLDGRFKGGYITRHYGKPDEGVHALQLEMTQRLYMNEEPTFGYELKRVKKLRPHLRDMLGQCVAWAQRPPTDTLPVLVER